MWVVRISFFDVGVVLSLDFNLKFGVTLGLGFFVGQVGDVEVVVGFDAIFCSSSCCFCIISSINLFNSGSGV